MSWNNDDYLLLCFPPEVAIDSSPPNHLPLITENFKSMICCLWLETIIDEALK